MTATDDDTAVRCRLEVDADATTRKRLRQAMTTWFGYPTTVDATGARLLFVVDGHEGGVTEFRERAKALAELADGIDPDDVTVTADLLGDDDTNDRTEGE